ncbi:hypothetical protein K1719_020470 [Acacia pycnantha]|nr:hypothetical protein K1719_020470 [Acacia pycnantha]
MPTGDQSKLTSCSRQRSSKRGTKMRELSKALKGVVALLAILSEGPINSDEDEFCDLFLEDPQRRLVAYGNAYNLSPTVHHKELKDDQFKVSILEVAVAKAYVLFPINDEKIVGDANNSFLMRPNNLVSKVVAAVTSPSPGQTKIP